MFSFTFRADLENPIPMGAKESKTRGAIRHFHTEPIRLVPGAAKEFNLGFKLYTNDRDEVVFEHRATPEKEVIEPAEWVGCVLQIPRKAVNFHDEYVLVVNFVKEHEFWFSGDDREANEYLVRFFDSTLGLEGTSPGNGADEHAPATVAENMRFGTKVLNGLPNPDLLPSDATELSVVVEGSAANLSEPPPFPVTVVFDVSDLIQYFEHSRLPTGIQRVQIEVISNLVFDKTRSHRIIVGCFSQKADFWVHIPPLFFNHLCKMALLGGDPVAADWRQVLDELRRHVEQAAEVVFPRGAYLVNLGTSWWLRNYFLNVRAAKSKYGIRYVPYVHDCIPIITPEHCVAALTRDFIAWAVGAFQHADHVMANSIATSLDVQRVADGLGHVIPPPSVVTLDADYRRATADLPTHLVLARREPILAEHGLKGGQYVLFVSTIESRKNHLLAFSAWLSLIKKHGARKIPTLVCVGNRGWLNDAIYAKLEASVLLKSKVVILSGIPDADLATLYQGCLFTIYPSSYEGWGLPVTESLCYSKVPLISDSSSLPEAGGDFAEYFDVRSESQLIAKIERLTFDAGFRSEREHNIRSRFRPRTWADISDQIMGLVLGWSKLDRAEDDQTTGYGNQEVWPFPVKLGQYYGLTEIEETALWPGLVSGELHRQGDGWWWPEPWGCWTKPTAALLAFLAPVDPHAESVIFVGVRGVQGKSSAPKITADGIGSKTVSLGPEQEKWVSFRLTPGAASQLETSDDLSLIRIRLQSDQVADFRESTGGKDHRVAGIGVRGFMICREDDVRSRMRLLEGIVSGDLSDLIGKPLEQDFFLQATT